MRKAMVINQINRPYILTIPQEVLPFCIVEENSYEMSKLIMENFIGFLAYDSLEEESDGFCLRFEKFDQWDSLTGFQSIKIPREVFTKIDNILDVFRICLAEGYYLICDYNQYYIRELGREKYEHHIIIINGFNDTEKYFSCYEFKNMKLKNYRVAYKELLYAATYYPWNNDDFSGIKGLKVASKDKHDISLFYLKRSIHQMLSESSVIKNNVLSAHGIYALRVFAEGIDTYPQKCEKVYRSHYLLNYLKEDCKLMQYRCEFINNNIVHLNSSTIESLYEYKRQINLLFRKALKMSLSGIANADEVIELIKRILCVIEKYKEFIIMFLEEVDNINTIPFYDDIYLNSRKYYRFLY